MPFAGHSMLYACYDSSHMEQFYICYKTMVISFALHFYMFTPLTQDGGTPLYITSQKGHSDVVSMLIRSGANVNLARNVRGDIMYHTLTLQNCTWFSHKAYSLLICMSAVVPG